MFGSVIIECGNYKVYNDHDLGNKPFTMTSASILDSGEDILHVYFPLCEALSGVNVILLIY